MFNFKLFKLLQNRLFSDTVVILSSRILPAENLSVEIPSILCLKKKENYFAKRSTVALILYWASTYPIVYSKYRGKISHITI